VPGSLDIKGKKRCNLLPPFLSNDPSIGCYLTDFGNVVLAKLKREPLLSRNLFPLLYKFGPKSFDEILNKHV
jgi:hypothetical protein